MPRGVRNTAQPKLPENVKWATHVPILVIPSAGHSRLAEGTEIAVGNKGRRQEVERRTPTNSKRETEVRLRYPPCCSQHKQLIEQDGVDALIGSNQLLSLTNRLSQSHGHGALRPGLARVDWQKCETEVPCQDCLDAAKEVKE